MKPNNPAAFIPVLSWLDAGAPHDTNSGAASFDMADVIGLLDEKAPSDIRDIARVTGTDAALAEIKNCGAVCCIAGALILFNPMYDVQRTIQAAASNCGLALAQDLTGMTFEDADELFTPRIMATENITPAWAATTIRNYLETGDVDWETCRPAPGQ